VNKENILYCIAAAATAIAGILHITLGIGNDNLDRWILFVIGGAIQIFWIVPTIRKWGLVWNLVGIGGTLVFIAIWAVTRMQDNPITGRGGPVSQNAIIVEIFQIAFIGLMVAIIMRQKRKPST
jgi:hypothetical protein